MSDSVASRRRADDGVGYTFGEFAEWYSAWLPHFAERWEEAPPVEDVQESADSAAKIALQLLFAFGQDCLCRALRGWFCRSDELAELVVWQLLRVVPYVACLQGWPSDERCEFPLQTALEARFPEEIVRAVFYAHPPAAALVTKVQREFSGKTSLSLLLSSVIPDLVLEERTEYRVLKVHAEWCAAHCEDEQPLPPTVDDLRLSVEELALLALCAFDAQCLLQVLEGCLLESKQQTERVAWELLRLVPYSACTVDEQGRCPLQSAIRRDFSPRLARAILDASPQAAGSEGVFREVASCGASAELLVDLFCGLRRADMELGDKAWFVAERFTPDREGLLLLIEAGATIADNFAEMAEEMERCGEHGLLRTMRAWRHGEAARRRFLMRTLSCVTARDAAAEIATLLCGECLCACPACCGVATSARPPAPPSGNRRKRGLLIQDAEHFHAIIDSLNELLMHSERPEVPEIVVAQQALPIAGDFDALGVRTREGTSRAESSAVVDSGDL